MGLDQGAYCVGSSWALMAALFALGVMSITWMVVIAALIVLEKVLPWRETAEAVTVVVLLALAIGVAFFPGQVPGLTTPARRRRCGRWTRCRCTDAADSHNDADASARTPSHAEGLSPLTQSATRKFHLRS